LTNADLSGANLIETDFTQTILTGVNLANADLIDKPDKKYTILLWQKENST
jgi:uncharacterized protein YjbI with pentapeptide repeats